MNDTQIKNEIVIWDKTKEPGYLESINENRPRPSMKGIVRLDGTEYEVALWPKKSAEGNVYWRGTIAHKQERMKREPKRDEFNERIPF